MGIVSNHSSAAMALRPGLAAVTVSLLKVLTDQKTSIHAGANRRALSAQCRHDIIRLGYTLHQMG